MSKQKKRWSELSPTTRGAIVGLGVLDVAMKGWALADLVNRPQAQVRGPKAAWAVALTIVNSVGVLPATYLLWARNS